MDTWRAYLMGRAARGQPQRVFDWGKAARIIKERQPSKAEAGLVEDWWETAGDIWRDGEIVPEDDTYTYLSSNWATPTLVLEGEQIACWIGEADTEWDAGTYWPQEARDIVLGLESDS